MDNQMSQSNPGGMPTKVVAYIAAVAVAGLAAVAYGVTHLGGINVVALEVFCVAAAMSEVGRRTSGASHVTISLSVAVILAAIVALGPGAAILVAASAALAQGLFPRIRPLHRTLFNIGLYTVGALASGLAFQAIAGRSGQEALTVMLIPAAIVATAANFAVNWPVLAGVIHLSTGRSLRLVWKEDISWTPAPILLTVVLGSALGANFVQFGWMGAAIVLVPLAVLQVSVNAITRRYDEEPA